MAFSKLVQTTNKGEVEVATNWRPKVGGYTVYNNKVYAVVASSGNISDFSITLESEVNSERFSVKQPEVGLLRELLKPTGYISC